MPAIPSGEVWIDFELEDPALLPDAIWINIGGRYEGFGLLREGRQQEKRKRPDMQTVPPELLQKEQEARIAAI